MKKQALTLLKLALTYAISWLIARVSDVYNSTNSLAILLEPETWNLASLDDGFAIFVFLLTIAGIVIVSSKYFEHKTKGLLLGLSFCISAFMVEILFILGSHFSFNLVPQYITNISYDFHYAIFIVIAILYAQSCCNSDDN